VPEGKWSATECLHETETESAKGEQRRSILFDIRTETTTDRVSKVFILSRTDEVMYGKSGLPMNNERSRAVR